MRLRILILALVVAAGAALAQRHPLGTVNAETPEGLLLQQIGQETDEAKKLTLLQQFAAQSPKHDAIGWVYEQMQAAYIKAGPPDKVIETGEKLLAMDADDLNAAYQSLKASEAKKDPDLVRKWSDRTSQIARKLAASPQPTDAEEVENWKKRVDYAKQVDVYTEYSIYAATLQSQDPRKRIELIEALNARNPKNAHAAQMTQLQFATLRQLGDNAKALALAEKTLETDQTSEDMLAYVANDYVEKKRDPDKVVSYSAKIVELMETKPKPEGVSDADWAKKKQSLSGLAHFYSGSTLFNQKKYPAADKELRAAIPQVEGNDQLKAAVLFYAGLANYSMKNIPDALKFNQQCAAIKSPFQAKAAENVRVMRSQGAGAAKK
jgi:tetratricopeptide (TPR) repeat protein